MAVVMDNSLKEKLDKVRSRTWWPVASLAEVLGRPKCYVYRKIEEDRFDVIEDGGYKKVTSQSVLGYYEKKIECNL